MASSSTQAFVCTLCRDSYKTDEDLTRHLTSCHNKNDVCPICDYKNDDIKKMIEHIHTFHLPSSSSKKKLKNTKGNLLHSNEEKEKRRKYQNQKRIYEETGQLPPNSKKRKMMPNTPIGNNFVYGFDGVIIFKR